MMNLDSFYHLNTLNLSHNMIQKVENLSNLKNLKNLNLSYNEL